MRARRGRERSLAASFDDARTWMIYRARRAVCANPCDAFDEPRRHLAQLTQRGAHLDQVALDLAELRRRVGQASLDSCHALAEVEHVSHRPMLAACLH